MEREPMIPEDDPSAGARSPRHAYLIAANANFRVLEIALSLIDDARNDIYILLDKKSRVSPSARERLRERCRCSAVTFCDDIVINWGGYSQIRAVLTLLERCLGSGRRYAYLHFIQGADLPIKSQDEIHAFFGERYGEQFVMVEKKRGKLARFKTRYRHFFCHNRFFRKSRLVKYLNYGLVQLQKLLRMEINTDIEPYQGSALFSVTEDCARYVLGRREEIYRRFRFSLAADEVFMQSILMDSPYREHIADTEKVTTFNARMIDRKRPDGKNSPHIWRAEETDALLSSPRGYCFARKFDETVDFQAALNIRNALCVPSDREGGV